MSKRKKFLTAKQMFEYSFYTLALIQIFGSFALLILFSNVADLEIDGINALATSISLSTFYSIVIVAVVWIAYALSRIKYWLDKSDLSFFLFFLLLFFFVISIAIIINLKIDILHWLSCIVIMIMYWLSCKWMGTVSKIILCLIAVACCVYAIVLLGRYENDTDNTRNNAKNTS